MFSSFSFGLLHWYNYQANFCDVNFLAASPELTISAKPASDRADFSIDG